MENAIRTESENLYAESSKLRALARMLETNGSTERQDVPFTANELDGFAFLLNAAADNIDAVRDNLWNCIFAKLRQVKLCPRSRKLILGHPREPVFSQPSQEK